MLSSSAVVLATDYQSIRRQVLEVVEERQSQQQPKSKFADLDNGDSFSKVESKSPNFYLDKKVIGQFWRFKIVTYQNSYYLELDF